MSRIQLKPAGITVLPQDKQIVSIEAFPPPPLWHTISNGQIQTDSRLQIVTAPGTVSGLSGNALYSAGGRLEWTINDNQKPTSTGALTYTVSNSSGSLKFQVQITSSQIIIKDEASITLFTQSYTPTTGDVFSVYIGDFFRLTVSGFGQLFARTGTPAISFPCTYTASLLTPVVGGSPAIAPPALIGDWRIDPNAPVVFIIGGGGSTALISPTKIEYTGSPAPGDYLLLASLASGQDPNNIQRAIALMSTPPLKILGENAITLQPGARIRPKTNYDDAQNTIVALSIFSGGGSLNLGEYTAPTTPGTSVIRATSAVTNSIADLTITVPAVINPAYTAVAPGQAVDLSTNIPNPAWTAGDGKINAITGFWIAPKGAESGIDPATGKWIQAGGVDRKIRITASGGGFVATRDIEILEGFVFDDPSAPITAEHQKTAIIETAEDRTRTSRVKDKDGLSFQTREVSFINKDLADLERALAFWEFYYPGKRFILLDRLRKKWIVCYFDSNLRWEADSSCAVDISFRIKEA